VSGGLWLSQLIDELQIQAHTFIEQGFRAMKIRVVSVDLHAGVQRVKTVRNCIDNHIDLLVDANQALDVKQAIRLGRALEPFNPGWLEEPVAAYDFKDHAQVTQALDVDIASGETEYTRFNQSMMVKEGDILIRARARTDFTFNQNAIKDFAFKH